MAKAANLKSDIQSTIQQSINEKQKQIVSSSAATKAGSTETPTVTDTPKVTQTAKAMPSVTRPDISQIVTPTVSQTPSAKDLFAPSTTPTLRKAVTPNLLNVNTEQKDIKDTTIPLNLVRASIKAWWQVANTVANNLYQQWLDWINNKFNKLEEDRKSINDKVWKTAIDMFKWVGEDLSTQWEEWKWLWLTKDAVLNTVQWLPRWIARIEYWLSELLDWGIDAQWATNLKNSIKRDLDYWEDTRTYKKVKETESFSDFLKNPLMYAGWTLWEMLPMFINAWVAVPTTYAQMYWDAYRDYAEDESLQDLTDNQIRLMATWVAWVNTIIELWADLIQWIMPWTKTAAKTGEKEVRRVLSKPISNFIRKIVKWWVSEWVEEVLQNEIQDQVAWFAGSDRDLPTWWSRLTAFWISAGIWSILQGWNIVVDINRHKELQTAFNERSEAVDKIAPWVSKSDKEKLFSAIVAAEIQDAQMDEDLLNKYEAQTTELYNQIEELNKQLETTTDENEKLEINRKIETATKKINDIDEIINSANKITEEVNAKLQELSNQKELEEIYSEINKSIEWENLQEQEMKNLSEQTMREVEEEKIPQTEDEFKSFASALKQPQNIILKTLSDGELLRLDEAAMNMTASADMDLASSLNYIREEIEKEMKERYFQRRKSTQKSTQKETTQVQKTTFKNAKDYVQKMIDIDKRNWKRSKSMDRDLRKKYMNQFLRTNLEWDFATHLPWLKWVNLKQIEWKLTEKNLKDITEMLSLVSTTLGIDFNKVIADKDMSMNIVNDIKDFLYNTGALWVMSWRATKEMVRDLTERTGELFWPDFWAELAKMWVAITLQEWPMKSGATMAHELMHLIDFAISTEEWLPLYFEWDKVTYTSIIKNDSSWKTYTKWNYNKNYYNRWQEILARYAEQYFAYKNDKDLFDYFTKRDWYWKEDEFLKLIPKFEAFIKDRLWAKLLDEENKFYYDIVSKMNENKFATISTEFNEEGLQEKDIKLKLNQIEEEYAFIMTHLNEMTWTLREEMEAYVQLSNLQSNYEMAKAKWEEYLEKLKTTPEQQWTIDWVTTTVLPPEPEPWNPNPTPPQNPETIKIWIPYFWWSNIENWIWEISEWWEWTKLWQAYIKEEDIIKIRKKKKRIKAFRKELWQAWKDIFTPAISRIYNISPRVAWRLITMETQKDINIHRYRLKAKWFVESLWKLKWKQALEVKMVLLDYWALASEQWEDIEQYKKDEVAKLKEVLLRNWFKEKDINDMFFVLDDIWQQYKDAWLSIALTDMYFPRVVKDYEWLIDYMNRVSWNDIKVNKISLMMKIKNIQSDPDLTSEEKEAKIRRAISVEFKQPWTTSQHWKERKMWKLSDWWEWIFAYYENPIESIDHYIVSMTNAIERQLFLWWLKEDADITESDILNQNTSESVSTIIWKLVEQWMVEEDDIEELQKSILAVINKKPSPKSVTALKDITYIATITNFLSAINQLDDLWMVILRDRSWLKHIVKAIFGKANIKYDDLWLEDSYEMFREEWWLTNWLFKKSLFNFFDRLGKTSFINAAWESMVRQSKNEKTRKYLYTRLVSMYWQESADRMMEKIDSWNYMWDDWQIDIEILRDLLYQLGSTQPIYTSAMSTTYLNHPWARLCYALSSFTLKRIDWLVQWAKEVNAKHWTVAAWAWLMWVSAFLAMFWAAIWDVWDLLKWKKEETFLWQLLNEWIDEALKSGWSDALNSWLKIWDLSDYDIKLYKQQWLWWVLSSKIKPFIFDLGKDVTEAVTEHNADEITDLAKYVPIFWKLVYYWCFKDIESNVKQEEEWDFGWEEEWDFSWEEEWDFSWEEEWDFS